MTRMTQRADMLTATERDSEPIEKRAGQRRLVVLVTWVLIAQPETTVPTATQVVAAVTAEPVNWGALKLMPREGAGEEGVRAGEA